MYNYIYNLYITTYINNLYNILYNKTIYIYVVLIAFLEILSTYLERKYATLLNITFFKFI